MSDGRARTGDPGAVTGAPTAGDPDGPVDVRVGATTLRVAIRHARAGSGRPPLLLLNGIGAALETLAPFVDALPPELEVIRVDMPGVGGSPLPPRPYTLASVAALTADLLTELDRPCVDVLGFSWGGALAQQLVMSRRDRVRRLVLVATATGSLMVPARPRVLSRMLTPRRYHDPAHAERIAAEIYGGSMRTSPQRAQQVLDTGRAPGPERGYRYQLLALAGWTSLPFLGLVRRPTLVVAGEDDPIVPLVNARILHRGIRGSALHIHGGGHLALLTEAGELAPVIDAFLTAPDAG
jgi:poly(3-hydroxyalkanoate) depolymerase